MKAIKALALVDGKNKLVPEFIITPSKKKWYILKKGEKFINVIIKPTK